MLLATCYMLLATCDQVFLKIVSDTSAGTGKGKDKAQVAPAPTGLEMSHKLANNEA